MRPLKPLTVLRRMRKLFSDKTRWTQRSFARRGDGLPVDIFSEEAVCWCIRGGYKKIDPRDESGAWEKIRGKAGYRDPVYVNDDRGYEAVLALLDRTIAVERAKGGRPTP